MLNNQLLKNGKLIVNKILRLSISKFLYFMHLAGAYNVRHGNDITILMYHKIDNRDDVIGLSIRPYIFEKQIEYLKTNYNVISLDEAVKRIASGNIDKKYIVITFDDGYRDNYTFAYPVLDKYKVPATIFLTCNSLQNGTFYWEDVNNAILSSPMEVLDLDRYGIGRLSIRSRTEKKSAIQQLHRALKKMTYQNMMSITNEIIAMHGTKVAQERAMVSCDEVKEMIHSGRVTIGSHTISHPILTKVGKEQAFEEINDSKKMLEGLFGCQINHFCYPNGTQDDFNDDIQDMVKKSGYKSACSTEPGFNTQNDALFKLRRLDITNNTSLNMLGNFSASSFAVMLSGDISRFKEKLSNKNEKINA